MNAAKILEKVAYMKTSTALVIMAVSSFFYFRSGYDSGSTLETQITAAQAKLASETEKKGKTEEAQKIAEDARKSVKKLAEDFDKISKKLPSNISSVDMNKAINQFVSQSGVKQLSVRPGTEVKKEIYQEFPFAVQLEGSFSQIAVFLYSVAKAERITAVKEFTILRPEPLGDLPLKFEAVVTSYKLAEAKPANEQSQATEEEEK